MHSPISRPQANATPRRSRGLIAACAISAASLLGCAATSPASQTASPELPSPPSLSTPQPAQPYSSQWQLQVEDWQKVVQESRAKLKGTLLMRD